MRAIINYFIKNSVAANLLMVGLFILGIMGMLRMQSNFFPDRPDRIISIQITYPALFPEEIEEGIINKIEENLKGLTGVERYTSVSQENSGTVTVEVLQGKNADLVLQDVKNAVDQINSFPTGMESPVIFKQENLDIAITFGISGDVDLRVLKQFGRTAEDDLLAMDGLSQVSLSGFPDEEIEIAFRESDLQAYALTFQEAALAVRNANLEITGGTVKGEQEELLIRARNKSYYAEGLADVVVKTMPSGSMIRLYQVADIRDKWADNPNRTYLNGKPAIVVTVQSTNEEDLIGITDKVKNYIAGFNERNQTVQAEVIRDGSIVLRQRIGLLTENGIIGFGLVLLLLAMFLNWRLAFWVALAIPISFAGMFIVASFLGVTINVISLFGMILVIGILVDDGIVIGESIYQEYEKGVPRYKAAIEGTMKVLPAVFSAILTTIIAFSSFFFLKGSLGEFFQEMAIVVIFSLIFSLVEGAFILPNHVGHSKALAKDKKKYLLPQFFEKVMIFMRDRLYAPVLRFAMYNKWVTISSIIAILFITVGAIFGGIIKTTFFPVIERDNVNIELKMPAGTRDYITEDRLNHIEKSTWEANEELSKRYFNGEKQIIQQVQKSVGPTSYEGSIDIQLLDSESRDTVPLREIINAIRKKVGPIFEAEVLTYGQNSFFGKPISVSLVGTNYDELDAATEALKAEMKKLQELVDVVDNNQEGLEELNVKLTEKGKFMGLQLNDVIGKVRQGFFGNEVQRLQRGRDEVRVWVRYDEDNRRNIGQLLDMRIRVGANEYPLSEIATIETEKGVIAINHIDGKREVKVEADIIDDKVSVSALTESLKTDIVPALLASYPSVTALYEGQNREQEKTQRSMRTVMPVILLLMFFAIALTFRSVSQTLVVLALIPFGLIGAAWGHWYMQLPISLFSALGLIALIGILVNDALVFVTTYNNKIEEGLSQMDAIYYTSLSRFRPIVLTSLTTIAGLLPLLAEKSLQAKFLMPMATSVSFGLMAITVIILVLLPCLIILTNRIKVYAVYLWEGVKPGLETVEPAFASRKNYFFLWFVAGIVSLGVFVGMIGLMMNLAKMLV